jgi:hypothetical protein
MENEFLRFEPVTSDPKAGMIPLDHGSNSMLLSKFVYLHLKLTSKHQITQLLMPISFALILLFFQNIFFFR